ncbi:MAG: class GN sortase [Maricaulaceae bacterium]
MSLRHWLGAGVAAGGVGLLAAGGWIEVKAHAAQVLLDRAWRETQADAAPVKPWPWADTWPVARLSAPRLDAGAVVLAEAGGEALAFAPAWLNASAGPGQAGLGVIAAHRATHFRFLADLQPGDRVGLETPDRLREYRVVSTRVVRFDRSGLTVAGPDGLALVTCWPLDAKTPGPLRLVVEAEPV